MARLITVLAVFLAIAWHSQGITGTDGGGERVIATEIESEGWRERPAPCQEEWIIPAYNRRQLLSDGRVVTVRIPPFHFWVACKTQRRRPIDYGGEY